jgi:GNAT superfamily N-acetyltransferase
MEMKTRQSFPIRIRRLLTVSDDDVSGLAAVLIDCVNGGASVGFMSPLAEPKARAFWQKVAEAVARRERALLVAEHDDRIVGTVQLILEQPENQPHRADVSKMLVAPSARRQGVGAALLRAAEELGRSCDRTLLVLDTANPAAERLYRKLGWQRCGVIPGFALLPHGGLWRHHGFLSQPLSRSVPLRRSEQSRQPNEVTTLIAAFLTA